MNLVVIGIKLQEHRAKCWVHITPTEKMDSMQTKSRFFLYCMHSMQVLKWEYCVHCVTVPQSSSEPRTALLTWQVVQKKMPWNIILLLGGGFALAKGSEVKFTENNTSYRTGKLRLACRVFGRHTDTEQRPIILIIPLTS